MAHLAACSGVQARSSFFLGAQLPSAARPAAARPAAALAVSARYRGVGTDMSKVAQFERHENDSGSPEAQVARLSARVVQLTAHLQQHKKDYSTTRGLMKVLAQRKQMLLYLQRTDRAKYEAVRSELGIRPLKVETGRS